MAVKPNQSPIAESFAALPLEHQLYLQKNFYELNRRNSRVREDARLGKVDTQLEAWRDELHAELTNGQPQPVNKGLAGILDLSKGDLYPITVSDFEKHMDQTIKNRALSNFETLNPNEKNTLFESIQELYVKRDALFIRGRDLEKLLKQARNSVQANSHLSSEAKIIFDGLIHDADTDDVLTGHFFKMKEHLGLNTIPAKKIAPISEPKALPVAGKNAEPPAHTVKAMKTEPAPIAPAASKNVEPVAVVSSDSVISQKPIVEPLPTFAEPPVPSRVDQIIKNTKDEAPIANSWLRRAGGNALRGIGKYDTAAVIVPAAITLASLAIPNKEQTVVQADGTTPDGAETEKVMGGGKKLALIGGTVATAGAVLNKWGPGSAKGWVKTVAAKVGSELGHAI